ncbi:helix-turn-helix transcriptional regulator [Lentzea sp. BCCO 10_0798]|uniref:Helix-turn-helix transcriptional regulator n=1 Tax=Lentzea kristufekii TaxID=3095430 RepID=A0ABU4U6N3_9PSEU|nr:helix-turn-helix transcriptional regulator [Lentzea sp. BCCO 10_0798]MDX8055666.1 helix-turn-helix transcriptional regulator [Lentzea sp. BCCO 10_0798]
MTSAESGRDEFGQELRRLRERAGLTRAQLAVHLGYHHTYAEQPR